MIKVMIVPALLLWLYAAAAGQAATLSSSGATDFDVGGTFYDVTFEGGSCADVFTGCDNATSDFFFTSLTQASAAAKALTSLIANSRSSSSPSSFEGCLSFIECYILTPTLALNGYVFSYIVTIDNNGTRFFGSSTLPASTRLPIITYAKWTIAPPPTAVPIPIGLPLFLTGLAGLAGLRSRRKAISKVQNEMPNPET